MLSRLRRSYPRVVAALCALVLIAVSCAPPSSTDRAAVNDYLKTLATWGPVEAETKRTIDRILKNQFLDEGEVRREIASLRPRVAAHREVVQRVPALPDALQRVHQAYADTWTRLANALDAIERGFDQHDQSALAEGADGLRQWTDRLRAVAESLRGLQAE